ncbi:MAG TPA: IPT/TIG domain-containing protein [Thermoanaerobaculia bacterium]|nr:IPT/TIG domain-containing protein [Thermoanaerobaculia bacterium]
MRYRSIAAIVVFLCGLPAFAQIAPPPVIQNVTPSSGSISGGTLVTLTGIALSPSCGGYMIGCEPVVRIGGVEAAIVERASNRLVVIAPPNSHGRADVEITTPGGSYRLAGAFSYGGAGFRRLLLPVYIDGEAHGAELSRWVTELFGFHRAAGVARVTGDPDTSAGTVAGRIAFRPALETARPGQGRFLYVADEDAEAVRLNLRVRDVSREADNLGTELPVIAAEQAFAAGEEIPLVNVPTQEQYRQKVRIYDLDGEYGRTVTVRIYGDDLSTPIATRSVTTSQAAIETDYPAYPGQGELDLNLLPELAGLDSVNIVIDTPDAGQWWAFASITNNTTQLITTVTP